MIEAILFDLDGVLVDACDWHYHALNKALERYRLPIISYEEHLARFNGRPTKVKLQLMGLSDDLIDEINSLKQSFTHDIISEHGSISNDKIQLLETLYNQGIKLACVTNSIRSTAEHMLKITGQLFYLDLVVSNEDVKNNKPAPDCYNLAIQKLGMDPKSCICVEDSPLGLQAARTSQAGYVWPVQNSNEVNLENYMIFTGNLK